MFFNIQNIKELINVTKILLWAGFIILFLYSFFIMFIRDKSLFFGSILKEPFSNFEPIWITIFCAFLLIEMRPFRSIWRFIVALIPFSFLVGQICVVIYALFFRT